MTSRIHHAELFLFARTPVLGAVKKRLAEEVGAREALEAHLELMELARLVLEKIAAGHPGLRLHLMLKGSLAHPVSNFGDRWTVGFQKHDDFGRNLEAPFAEPLNAPALVIGADHPAMTPGHIEAMLHLLRANDTAIGPAEDGGFWSLGSNVPLKGIFDAVPLGTEDARAALSRNLSARDLSTAEGPPLWDVDTEEDLARWRKMQKK